LIRAAYQPADPGIMVDPAPFPMAEPLGTYRSTLAVASRAIRFAAMALVDGDRGQMIDTLTVLERGTLPLLFRHLDITDLVIRGAARALGRRPDELGQAEDAVAPFVAEVTAHVVEAAQ
jgi:hypothetical protein